MKHIAPLITPAKRLDPYVLVGFLIPVGIVVLIGLAIHAHSKPIRAPLTQTTNASGSVTATTPANPPSAAEVDAAKATILAYCRNDLRQDTSCTLVPNSDKTAPGFVETTLQMNGNFASDGASSQGFALAKGSGSSWSVIWVGQNCIPHDVADQNSVPATMNICSS